MNSLLKRITPILQMTSSINILPREIHTCQMLNGAHNKKITDPVHFLYYNKKVYPPQSPDEPRRTAYVCHQKTNIKYSPDKMWYIAELIRGMSIDEALKQIDFVHKKGAPYIKETLLEAQENAVKYHNVEFKSNLWVAESFATKGYVMKGIRRHAKGRSGEVSYRYCHYFVRLEEGTPPNDYRPNKQYVTGEKRLDNWLENLRKRKIPNTL